MNWRESLNRFYNSFDITAYPTGQVPEKVVFPWMTYETSRGDFGDETNVIIHTHHYTESEAVPNQLADDICAELRKGVIVSCDEGKIVLTTGLPEWNSVDDEADAKHKHRIINVSMTWFLTGG